MPGRLRIFLSSPSDVGEERLRAHLVIQKLARDYARFFSIEPILWEYEPMLASGHFQDAVEPPSLADIMVLVLWSRMGTPLPQHTSVRDYRGIDGRAPVTGTEWEFEDALAANRAKGAPDILAYRRLGDPGASLADPVLRAEQERQWNALESFWRRHFEDRGVFTAGSARYKDLDEFDRKLEADLICLIERRIKQQLRGEDEGRSASIWFKGSPFRGLSAYGFEDAPVFFGRDGATRTALIRLADAASKGTSFLLILGASGSGKSSVARAGLLPALAAAKAMAGVGLWRRVVMRPGDAGSDPVLALAQALLAGDPARDEGLPELVGAGLRAPDLARYLRSSAGDASLPFKTSLHSVTEKERDKRALLPHEEARLVLLVDQLEELFTRPDVSAQDRVLFARLLSGLAHSGAIWVVATMRSDLWYRVAEIPELLALTEAGGRMDLLHPDDAELLEMVRRPAAAAGLSFETDTESGLGLDAVLARAAAKEPGALPLLSVMLETLYRRDIHERAAAVSSSRTLTFASYRALGELRGAIAQRAEETVAALGHSDPDAAGALPQVLRSLVTTGVGDAVTSRPATLSQFAEGSPARRLIEALLDSRTRLLTADRSEANAEIRIAHEALIEYWPRAKRQIATDRRDIETRARLEALLRRYEEAPDTEKHRALLQALNLEEGLDLTRRWGIPAETPLGAFISASDAAHKAAVAAEVESAKRRSRRFLAGAAVLVVIFAGIAALVGWQSLRLTRERDAARLAQSRVVAAIADKVANEGDYGSALALALEALAGHERRNAALYPSEAERALDNAVRNLRETRVLRHGQENVLKVALSPDGRRIATASRDGTARIWDRGTGSEILHLNAHRSEIDALAFSADGCCVVTGSSKDTTARVWNPDTGAEIRRFDIAPNDRSTLWFSQGSSFALTADAQRIAGVSTSGTARVWEVATGRMVNTFPIEKNSVPISFSSDGRRLLTASERRARIYDIDSGETRASFSADDFTYPIHSGGFSSNDRYVVLSAFGVSGIWDAATGEELEDRRSGPFLAFSADGRNYAVSKDNTARLIQLEDGKELAVSHPEPSYRVNFARFSPTGNKILTVHADFSVHMWAAASGARDTILKGHEGRITDAAFSPDEKSIITVSDDSTAREWDIAKQASITLRDSNLEPHIRFFPDGRSLLTAEENEAAIRDAETGKKVRTFRGHEAPIVDAALSADGRRVATASFDDTVRIWDAQTAEVIAVLGHDQKIRRLALSPDGRRILTDSFSDRIVRIWDAETGNEVARLATDRVTYEMAFSRDGHLVQTNGEKGVHFWDASTGNEVKLVHDRENRYQRVAFSPIDDKFAGLRNEGLEVRSIASGDLISKIDVVGASMRHFDFSPDGKLVVAGLQDKTARAWSASTGRPVLTLMGHDDGVTHAAVSPDGKLIVTSSRDRTVRVWDAETQTEIAILRGPDNADESKFSLSGRLVVSISNNLVQVWRVFGSVQELINQACKIAPRFLSSKQRGSFAVNVSSVGTACQK